VVGPIPDEPDARPALEASLADCAFVDVNLGSGRSVEMPRDLLGWKMPFAFVTSYDAGAIPIEFEAVNRCEKPSSLKASPLSALACSARVRPCLVRTPSALQPW